MKIRGMALVDSEIFYDKVCFVTQSQMFSRAKLEMQYYERRLSRDPPLPPLEASLSRSSSLARRSARCSLLSLPSLPPYSLSLILSRAVDCDSPA